MAQEFLNGCIRLLFGKEALIGALQAKLETNFEQRLFEAAINNLLDAYNPLRFNNFAYATRELVRHILTRLAPDGEVRACTWYKNETQNQDGITRGQRILYAIQGGLSGHYVSQTLEIDTRSIQKSIKAVVENLSKHTHIQPETLDIETKLQDQYVSESLESVAELFRVIEDARSAISDALTDHIDTEIVNRVLRETIVEIDEVATHHTIEEVCVEEVHVAAIRSSEIRLRVGGTISAELQYGSNGDLRRGDGALLDHEFPFSCELSSDVTSPGKFANEPEDFQVSNDDWYK